MKKAFTCIILVFAICLSITGCNIKIDTEPDEWRIFHNQKQYSLSDYHIDYLKLSRYGTELAMIYDYDDMIALFDMANELVLTKSHESNNLPPDFELLCTVSFVREYEDRANVSYYFNVSTTGEICYLRDRIAAVSVVYVGNSTEILDEVNRLIELYALNEEEHEHTITYVSAGESGHFENYTCGCPHDHGDVPHYDENDDYICDACGYVMPEHEHTGKWYKNETIHFYEYTCGCVNNDIAEHHVYGDDNGSCVICGYVIGGTATNTGKVQTTIGEEASLPQFMSLEVDKHNALSSGGSINVDVYMGYDILNKDGAAFSDIIVPESDFGKYTFVLEVNYNNEERVIVLDSVNYFEEYRCNIYQDVVQYSKYNTVQLDTTKMTGKSYGFVNLELIMLSDTNERYYVSAETLYYSVTDTEIVFGLVSNPVATEGDPGIITKGWTYEEK